MHCDNLWKRYKAIFIFFCFSVFYIFTILNYEWMKCYTSTKGGYVCLLVVCDVDFIWFCFVAIILLCLLTTTTTTLISWKRQRIERFHSFSYVEKTFWYNLILEWDNGKYKSGNENRTNREWNEIKILWMKQRKI